MQSILFRNEFLNHSAPMNRMAVNDQNQMSRNETQQLFDKSDHLFSGKRMPIGLNTQPYPSAIRRNQQGAQKIEALVVRNTGPLDGCLTPPRPGAFEWGNQ